MGKQSDSDGDCCPIGRCIEIVGGKWTLLVIRDLVDGPKHYVELQRSLVGITPRVLCQRLEFLTEHGLISRTRIKALPPRTLYELTDRGRSLIPLVGLMREIGMTLRTG